MSQQWGVPFVSPVPAHLTGYSNACGARRFYLMRSTSYKSAPKLNLTRVNP